jgi:2-amino-4,5-dihydroxy-6-oxo-7-(phosphonooxy)heptanoate synthase
VAENRSFGSKIRHRRLYRHGDERLFVVPLDHSVTDGPIVPDGRLDVLIEQLADGGADAFVLHKGSLRRLDPTPFRSTSLIVHLSASTAHAPNPDAKYLVSSVEYALRLGADAVSVHVNVGSTTEHEQVADLAAVADAADRCGVPVLAMMYPRGPRIPNPRDPELIAHAATLAADLGADLVKVPYVGEVAAMSDVVRSCPIPILVAGGALLDGPHALTSYVGDVMRAGTAGVAMGRNVFRANDPRSAARRVAQVLHHEAYPVRLDLAAS